MGGDESCWFNTPGSFQVAILDLSVSISLFNARELCDNSQLSGEITSLKGSDDRSPLETL